MPAQLGLMPEHRAQLGRNVHDLSHDFGFTCTCGHLLPVFTDILNPDEKVNVSFSYELRTMPLESAAMVDFEIHTEYFFVPLMLLYSPFEMLLSDTNSGYSSSWNPVQISGGNVNAPARLPLLDFDGALSALHQSTRTFQAESCKKIAARMFEMFGFDSQLAFSGGLPSFFPAPWLAYHAIYQYYYRLDAWEKFSPLYFNWDRFYVTTLVNDASVFNNLFILYTRPFANDYFTDIKPSPIVDVLNLDYSNAYNLTKARQWMTRQNNDQDSILSNAGSVPGNPQTENISGNAANQTTLNFGFNSNNWVSGEGYDPAVLSISDINTANIRAMFANEKYWSITGRTKKNYDDQMLAHLGVKVPHDVKHELSVFGHDIGHISIGEVISTASTQDAPLGEIAGKGYAADRNKVHTFTAPVHGVLMVMFSIVPKVNYRTAIPKWAMITDRNSFYRAEYDHLGMQPLFHYETEPEYEVPIPDYEDSIYGWQYRYEEKKRRFNRVTRAFTADNGLDSWMLNILPFNNGGFEVTPNVPRYMNFHYYANCADQVFLQNYQMTIANGQSTADGLFDTDPFVVHSHIMCKKISYMSDYSLPKLVD